jgi:cytidyltransferase-like protein
MLSSCLTKKVKTFQEIIEILETYRCQGLKIIQCHGVFDLLHPGHIRYFKAAKQQGDILIVTLTPDRFVNKGPGRPVFTELLRLESIAALEDVDYVVLNDAADAVSAILKIKPFLYVKGIEYQDHSSDITGKIEEEVKAVEFVGGQVFYTDEITFSSSSLLNRYFENYSQDVTQFLQQLKQEGYTSDQIIKKIEALKDLKVLVIGDAIIDEYQYVEPMGQSGKGFHMVARCREKEVFLGGSLIVANHIAQFTQNITLLTGLGERCPYFSFIHNHLDPLIEPKFTWMENIATLVKKRYLLKDGNTLTKFFETYSGQEEILNFAQSQNIVEYLQNYGSDFDLVLVCDFGNGFTNTQIINAISNLTSFVSLNTQTNSGNRGFHAVTNYHRANYISLNEAELRLAAHDRMSSLESIAFDICQIMQAQHLCVTRGTKGIICHSKDGDVLHVPAFASNSVDRIGAGDSFFSLSSLCFAKDYPPIVASFVGSIAAAISVQMIGNQEPIKKDKLCKFIVRLMK